PLLASPRHSTDGRGSMRKLTMGGLALLAVGAIAAVAGTTTFATSSAPSAKPDKTACALGDNGSKIKHLIYLQFDHTHFRPDRDNVQSDLEQMPHLLDFLKSNGTLFTNDHTILISHTAGGILSSLTGLYPDRAGQPVSNSYDYYAPGVAAPKFTSSFKYWTD